MKEPEMTVECVDQGGNPIDGNCTFPKRLTNLLAQIYGPIVMDSLEERERQEVQP